MVNTLRRKMTILEADMLMSYIPVFLEHVREEGSVPETMLNAAGFPLDATTDGTTVRRRDQITAEGRQRSKVLTHDSVKRRRAASRLEIERAKAEAEAIARSRFEVTIEASSTCEVTVLAAAATRIGEGASLEDTRLSDWCRAKVNQLRAFIRSRKGCTSHRGKPISKGNLTQAEAAMTNNASPPTLVSAAFKLRSRPISVEAPTRQAVIAPPLPVIVAATQEETASSLLACPDWMELLHTFVRGRTGACIPSSSTPATANRMVLLMRERLQLHVARRVTTQAQRDNAVWDFFSRNLPRLCLIGTLFGHFRTDATTVAVEDSLLSASQSKFLCAREEQHESWQGCYLFADLRGGTPIFVRSGKVSGGDSRTFGSRLDEHADASRLVTPESRGSKFYLSYPSSAVNSKWKTLPLFKGHHEALTAVVGVGYTRDSAGVLAEGLFLPAPRMEEKIAARAERGVRTASAQRADLLAYSFELLYDLAIGSSQNLSTSPGFESFTGVHSYD